MRSTLYILFLFIMVQAYNLTTRGPRGETPVPTHFIMLRQHEIPHILSDSLTLAIAFHDTSSDFSREVLTSIQTEAQKLHIATVFTACAQFHIPTQKEHYSHLRDINPDLLITLVLSPTETSKELQILAKEGTSIAFLSNLPQGLNHKEHYASVITDDLFEMGRTMAKTIASKSGNNSRLVYIYHDADYYVTNQRDQSLRNVLRLAYPSIKVVKELPFSDLESIQKEIDRLIQTQPTSFDAIYTPWATIADALLETVSAADIPYALYTIDKSVPVCRDLRTGKNVQGIVIDNPVELGRALLISAILHHYGKATPPFATVPVSTITAENVDEQCGEGARR